MHRIARLLLPICLLLMAASCSKKFKKQDDVVQSPTSPGGPSSFPMVSLNQLLKSFRYAPEENCVAAGFFSMMPLASGDTLMFYPWSFKDGIADTTITTGTVCVKTIALHSPADIIMNRSTGSTANGGMLRTAGHMYVEARMGETQVKLIQYGMHLKHRYLSSERMDMARGTVNATDSLVRWQMVDSVGAGTTAIGTTVDTVYRFDSVSGQGWLGAAQPFDTTTARAGLKVYLSAVGLDSKNTAVYVVLPSINCVLPVTFSRYTGYFELGLDDASKIREGMKAHVIAIGRNSTSYYYFEQKDMVVKDGMIVTATPTLQTFDYIRTSLYSL